MTLPVRPVVLPSCLAGHVNGKLPDALLVDTPGLGGGPVVRLVAPAARAWRAKTAHASRDGIVLRASSLLDSYRPYEVQERIFRQRYTTTPLPGRPSKVWRSQRWWLRPGYATAAVPGRSNHGLGITVDEASELDGDPAPESLSDAALAWLLEHAEAYGWSWELQDERWHLRYFAGDAIPAAVLAHEAAPIPDTEDDMLNGFDQGPEDVARGIVRMECLRVWGTNPDGTQEMTAADQAWLIGEWRKHGRDHAMALIADHRKAAPE